MVPVTVGDVYLPQFAPRRRDPITDLGRLRCGERRIDQYGVMASHDQRGGDRRPHPCAAIGQRAASRLRDLRCDEELVRPAAGSWCHLEESDRAAITPVSRSRISAAETQHGTQRSMVDRGCDDLAVGVALEHSDAADLHAAERRCSPLQITRRAAFALRR